MGQIQRNARRNSGAEWQDQQWTRTGYQQEISGFHEGSLWQQGPVPGQCPLLIAQHYERASIRHFGWLQGVDEADARQRTRDEVWLWLVQY